MLAQECLRPAFLNHYVLVIGVVSSRRPESGRVCVRLSVCNKYGDVAAIHEAYGVMTRRLFAHATRRIHSGSCNNTPKLNEINMYHMHHMYHTYQVKAGIQRFSDHDYDTVRQLAAAYDC